MCEATAADLRLRTRAGADRSLQGMLDDMASATPRSGTDRDASRGGVIAHWRNGRGVHAVLSPKEYAEVELVGASMRYGLLRVTKAAHGHQTECNWPALESVMYAAAPYLVICLEREAGTPPADASAGG